MDKVTLAKNSKTLKFPRQSGSVKSTFESALRKAKEQKWTKVIIIGTGKEQGHWFRSRMSDHAMLGMLEEIKYLMNKDHFG